uniref:Carbonic anhydrase n=1 Tax=Corallium rubrum TaxID=142104 RepID=A0A1B0Y2D6_9CNID|nr:alpha carbonic anhydrase 6 [Corallium rubrum]
MNVLIMSVLFFASCFQLFDPSEAASHGQEWSYEGKTGPSFWYHSYPKCSGDQQSPIDIEPRQTTYKENLENSLVFNYGWTNTPSYIMKNNGHSLQVNVPSARATLTYNAKSFALDQFHFHWGCENGKGSEHLINGLSYPAELHLVHHNERYSSLAEAVDKPDGLAVVSVMIKVGRYNKAFRKFLRFSPNVIDAGQSVYVPSFDLTRLLPGNKEKFYRYDGSLTTPPCYESVTWTVMDGTIEISQSQLNRFRKLRRSDGQALVDNFRPVQPTNNRMVFRSFA